MIKQQDLNQVKEYMVDILPQLLREKPEILTGILPQLLREEPAILTSIEGIIAQQFPPREEFVRLLEAVKLQHEDSNQRLGLLEQNFELLHRYFEGVDKRFEAMDRRIDLLHEEMKHRFTEVDKRFEQVDKRFEQVDKRFDAMDRRIDLLHEEMNHRFDEVDKRFEQVDKRFDAMDRRIDLLHEEMNRRFEQVDKRFDLLQEEMNLRFEQVHREQLDLKRRIIKVESSVDKVLDKMEKFDAWLKVISGDKGTEKGQTLEDLFALALQYGLNNPDIKPETIQLRQDLFDPKGQVFLRKGYATEIDLIAENGKMTVFEIKASADKDDVDLFAMKVQLVQLQNPKQAINGVFISPGMADAVAQRCTESGLEFLA
jgi:hypothetical protein